MVQISALSSAAKSVETENFLNPQNPTISEQINHPASSRPGHRSVRILACGVLGDVDSIIQELHVRGFADIAAWSPPVPSGVPGEVLRILTRFIAIEG